MLVVDAANVVGSRPDGWWKDRAGAAARLVASLQHLGGDVTVVLEGAARAGVPAGPAGVVRVVHAPGSGDDAVVALSGPEVVVVTADRELRSRVQDAGATVRGPRWLRDQLARD